MPNCPEYLMALLGATGKDVLHPLKIFAWKNILKQGHKI